MAGGDADALSRGHQSVGIFVLTSISEPKTVNLKCDPDRAVDLRERFPDDIFPGFHMNKKHWNTVSVMGSLDHKQIRELIQHSYSLVLDSLSKNVKATLI
ncbi:MAG: MmcQ/YjbR family DNA-binding protein [Candidatus Accumulibacter sp.]|nr:MmcQ/YjbR family DNA-binding protein [Accumulibacter sp.]